MGVGGKSPGDLCRSNRSGRFGLPPPLGLASIDGVGASPRSLKAKYMIENRRLEIPGPRVGCEESVRAYRTDDRQLGGNDLVRPSNCSIETINCISIAELDHSGGIGF